MAPWGPISLHSEWPHLYPLSTLSILAKCCLSPGSLEAELGAEHVCCHLVRECSAWEAAVRKGGETDEEQMRTESFAEVATISIKDARSYATFSKEAL